MDGLARAWEEADPVESGGFEASPDAPTPAGPREPASNYFDEEGFQDWYGRWSTIAGIDPNPDAPEHKYDYRAAYKVDAKPDVDESSGEYHWPSAFKADDHPNRYIDNFDTKSGIDMQAVMAVRGATTHRIAAAGGIATWAEIDALDAVGVDAVVGMAVYTGTLPLTPPD